MTEDIINTCFNNSYYKQLRVFVYVRRFLLVQNNEIKLFFLSIIKNLQAVYFAEEIELIKDGHFLSKSNKLINLNPFLDLQGILRVRGRLRNPIEEYDMKHQIILPWDYHFTKSSLHYLHVDGGHFGCQTLLTSLCQ